MNVKRDSLMSSSVFTVAEKEITIDLRVFQRTRFQGVTKVEQPRVGLIPREAVL